MQNQRTHSLPSELVDDVASIGPRALLERYLGPGVLLSATGEVLASSKTADDLVRFLSQENEGPTDMGNSFLKAAHDGMPLSKRCVVPALGEPKESHTYDVTALPVQIDQDAKPGALLLARNVSFERNLLDALESSRTLYRDLANCSGDFVWEVDASSRFSFVSPQGVVGYLPHALNGASPAGMALDPHEARNLVAFFASRDPITEMEVWVRGEDGHAACLVGSVRPMWDELGQWSGARGVARDVTAERRRARELREQREDDALISAIARAVQEEMQPEEMLQAAARVLVASFKAAASWIVPLRASGEPVVSPVCHATPEILEHLPSLDFQSLMDSAALSDGQSADYQIWRQGPFLCLLTHHWDVMNGLVVLLDVTGRAEAMLEHVAAHLSNAIEQARQLRELDRLSRTDELTGLLNRRAFISSVTQCVEQGSTQAQEVPGSLMFIDMDNFKMVNDTHGHAAGDALLKELSALMQETVDDLAGRDHLAARLGGDEFALWLSGSGEASAALANLTAERLVRGFEVIAVGYEGEARPGLSIGVANAHGNESLEDIMERADLALYEAKRSGKGTWKVSAMNEDDDRNGTNGATSEVVS